jgi:hypothetical protein
MSTGLIYCLLRFGENRGVYVFISLIIIFIVAFLFEKNPKIPGNEQEPDDKKSNR